MEGFMCRATEMSKIEVNGDICPALTHEFVGHRIPRYFACNSSIENLLAFRKNVCSLTATKAAL
jgi:hypothetical protein